MQEKLGKKTYLVAQLCSTLIFFSDHVYDLTLTKQGNVTVNSDVTQTSFFFSILAISIPIEDQRLKS